MMYRRHLQKADGRGLILYARTPLDEGLDAPSPGPTDVAQPHLRWHPLQGEWVAYAGHRQGRTFLPAFDHDPLAPSGDPSRPSEVPAGRWDVAVFDNRFPALAAAASEPPPPIHRHPALVPAGAARGGCEVIVFTQEATGSLGALPLDRLALVVDVWADRTEELGRRDDVEYVLPFENRGVEVGVTLPHPHGQIYAYPFLPPVAARELAAQHAHRAAHGRGLLEALIVAELDDGRRLVHVDDDALAFAPVCARFPYEVWVAPRRPVAAFPELTDPERRALARTLKTTLMKLDALWARPMPYVLAFHQAPTDGRPHPEAHLHAEVMPFARMPGRLKYLAGSEVGAGVFVVDVTPEQAAAELGGVDVDLGAGA